MPSTTNRAKAWTSKAVPASRIRTPSRRAGSQYVSAAPGRHRVSHQGSRPATVPGARAKNTALPAAATLVRMYAIVPSTPVLVDTLQAPQYGPGQAGRNHLL